MSDSGDDTMSCYYDAGENNEEEDQDEEDEEADGPEHASPIRARLAVAGEQAESQELITAPSDHLPDPNTPTQTSPDAASTPRPASVDGRVARPSYRYSLPGPIPIPAVPAIPEHLLATGKPATLYQRRKGDSARQGDTDSPSSPALHIQRPSTSGSEIFSKAALREPSLLSPRSNHVITNITNKPPHPPDNRARRKSLPAPSHRAALDKLENAPEGGKMHRFGKGKREDLFLEIAKDEGNRDGRPSSRNGRAGSRLSIAEKRRSLPADGASFLPSDSRPRTSGAVFGQRLPSRLESQASELHRHVERYRNAPSRASFQADDAVSISTRSRSGLPLRYAERATTISHPQLQEESRSLELPHYGRRRPSLTATSQTHRARSSQTAARQQDSYNESPADVTDPKQSFQDSSAESETQDTVWDELDDLKSRIKKLELTGKLPPNSGQAASNESSDRPRTATTAPTTIDSSPKHKQEKKPSPEPAPEAGADPEDESPTNVADAPNISSIHPNLHAALAKAKLLLNGPLYRTLEATAADALQLAAMTGSAGPQGTTYTAAAIINGVTVSDRHVRRKADTMCRNLTDLCLALCDGKHEAHSILASPVALGTPSQPSPSIRLPRNNLDPNTGANRSGNRPMSRLEARRTSILGSQPSNGNLGPSGSEDLSASEQEATTPSNPRSNPYRRPSSRFQPSRLQRRNDEPPADDNEPTLRPASRAFTDVGRAKPLGPREYATPQRSPSLRDALVARRASANAAAIESNRELHRAASLTSESAGRRRFHDPATPPVLEEEAGAEEWHTPPSSSHGQSKRRIHSLGSRRVDEAGPTRAASLHYTPASRRRVAVE